jgi:hypothetical protein
VQLQLLAQDDFEVRGIMATPVMPTPKNDQITALALEVLKDAEMSRTSLESLVLKASRLARLVEDEETIEELRDAAIIVQDSDLESQQTKLSFIKSVQPWGGYSGEQFLAQKRDIERISDIILAIKHDLSKVRTQIQEYATRIYCEQLFSHQAQTIFTQYQNEVDALLADKAKTAFNRLPQAFERLGAGDREAISHAMTTCRRVIDGFTDAVYPPRAEPAHIGEQEIEVGATHTRNRLRAYVHERVRVTTA